MKLFRKARRRKPGIYVYRTFRHMRPGTEWGYGGMSTNLPLRAKCHAGTCVHARCLEKPWYDLKSWYWELPLPWWLGWKWLLLTLETIMLVLLWPRYNVQNNPRPNKVGPYQQKIQRAARDRVRAGTPPVVTGVPAMAPIVWRLTGAVLIVSGLAVPFINR